MTQEDIVAIVGGGRLGMALARGLAHGGFPSTALLIAQRSEAKRTTMAREGFQVVPPIADFSHVAVVVIAVKPADVRDVLRDIARSAHLDTIVISAAVGVAGHTLLAELGAPYPVIRAMFSIFAESNQKIIPVFPCNAEAEAALELPHVQGLFKCLGDPQIVSEDVMEMSGWDLSTLSGVIVAQMLRQRLMQVPLSDRLSIEELLAAGINNLARYLDAARDRKQPLVEALSELSERIATPGGRNETMLRFLDQHGFWQLLADARESFAAHQLPSDPLTHPPEHPMSDA